jgi:hypothetical protein
VTHARDHRSLAAAAALARDRGDRAEAKAHLLAAIAAPVRGPFLLLPSASMTMVS